MLNWVLSRRDKTKKKKSGIGVKPSYERAKTIAAKGSVADRVKLAGHEDLEPELLYFFASDESAEVRREVAENTGTPLQADLILSKDEDDEVRCELAVKIGRLVPQLTAAESEKLSEMALEVLAVLAHDELPRVRAIISEELKNADNVPKKIVRNLAEDLEDIVSVPILEYSPLLSDTDLVEIIARGAKPRALVAVARRRDLDAQVVDAVVATEDEPAVQAVLENKTVTITERTFDEIAGKADKNPDWHNAMVFRDDIPVRTIMRIASFVSAALMEALIERNAHQEQLVEHLRKTVRQRIEKGELSVEEADGHEPAKDRAQRDFEEGNLDGAAIAKALEDSDKAYVRYALILLTDLTMDTVSRLLNTGNAKSITALAWKAGLDMDLAMSLQTKIGRIKSDKVLRPKADGTFPLSKDDIEWYEENFFS